MFQVSIALTLITVCFAIAAVLIYHVEAGISSRVIGGKPKIVPLPNEILIQYNGESLCGGSILTSTMIITSAHCFASCVSPAGYTVREGSNALINGVAYSVKNITCHANYNPSAHDYDIAIVILNVPLLFAAARTITVAPPNWSLPIGANLTVSGWGVTSAGASSGSTVLNSATVQSVDWSSCNNAYGGNLTERMICAAAPGKRPCEGDLGGSLVENSSGYLVGIVSWGIGCAQANYPAVYTNVANVNIRHFIATLAGVGFLKY